MIKIQNKYLLIAAPFNSMFVNPIISQGHNLYKLVYTFTVIIYSTKKLRKSQRTMQHENTKANNYSNFFICLDTCHRLGKMFTLVC